MDIACCTDHIYLKYCITMLLSLFNHHRGEDVRVHLLANGLQPNDVDKVRRIVEVNGARLNVYEVDGGLLNSLTRGQYNYITPTTYARLFLPNILPVEVDKVVYLDCDLLVMDSLKALWQFSLGDGYELAAVVDSCSANTRYYERLRLPSGHRYFNAGVLLIDLAAWRKRGFVELAMELLENGQLKLDYADQDVLNVLCAGRTKYLSVRYNLQEAMLRRYVPEIEEDTRVEIVDCLSSPAVIHFTYILKPWCYLSFHPYRKHFYHYFDQTEWRGERPVPRFNDLVKRIAWWGAAKFNLVNKYHPLPRHMEYARWKKAHQPLQKRG